MSDKFYSGTRTSLYKQFKEMVNQGCNPFYVAERLKLTEDELIDFEVSYANEKQLNSMNDDDYFPFDGEAA